MSRGLPLPVQPYNPGEHGGTKLRLNGQDVSLTAVFAALCVVINVVKMFSVGNPFVAGPVQLRIAICLISLAALFGWPVAFGVTVGRFVSNFLSKVKYFLGPV